MFGFALVLDFLVFLGIVAVGVYLAAMIRDGARLLQTLGVFAGLGLAVPVCIAAANTIGMTADMFTWVIFPFMPPSGAPWTTVAIAILMNAALYAALGAALWIRNRHRGRQSRQPGLGL